MTYLVDTYTADSSEFQFYLNWEFWMRDDVDLARGTTMKIVGSSCGASLFRGEYWYPYELYDQDDKLIAWAISSKRSWIFSNVRPLPPGS